MTGVDETSGGPPQRAWSRRLPPFPVPTRRRRDGSVAPARPVPGEPRPVDDIIGDCRLYREDGHHSGRMPFADAARAAHHGHGFVWIGLRNPTADEVGVVAEAFDLPHLAVEDAIGAHQRPKLEHYGDVVFMVLKPVRYIDSKEIVDVGEIAVFVGPHYVVTVRHGESDVLAQVRREMDDLPAEVLAHGPAVVLYRAADLIVDGYESAAAAIEHDVDEIEDQVFDGSGHDHSERIYKLKREVLDFRRAVVPLGAPLERLAAGAIPGIDPGSAPYFRDVHDHLLRAAEEIDAHDKSLSDILSAELAKISVRQNETAVRQNEDMRKISAWAAIALVPTAVAGIYGMNFDNMPELHEKYGYFVVLGLIVGACVTLYLLFRRNGWL